jgi:hypothetical protein
MPDSDALRSAQLVHLEKATSQECAGAEQRGFVS